jgi:hypothetical protein
MRVHASLHLGSALMRFFASQRGDSHLMTAGERLGANVLYCRGVERDETPKEATNICSR